jgi:hypothetical protein
LNSLIRLILLIIPLSHSVAANESISEFLGDRVTFSPPSSWEIISSSKVGKERKVKFLIAYDRSSSSASKNAYALLVIKEDVSLTETVQDSDLVAASKAAGKHDIGTWYDDLHWKTAIWHKNEKPFRLNMERFGVDKGVSVDLVVSIPFDTDHNQQWTLQSVSDFNAICTKLQIDGNSSCGKSRVIYNGSLYLLPDIDDIKQQSKYLK